MQTWEAPGYAVDMPDPSPFAAPGESPTIEYRADFHAFFVRDPRGRAIAVCEATDERGEHPARSMRAAFRAADSERRYWIAVKGSPTAMHPSDHRWK